MTSTLLLFCVLVLLNVYMYHLLQESISALQNDVMSVKMSESINLTMSGDQREVSLVQSNMKKNMNKVEQCKSTDYVKLLKSVNSSSMRGCDKADKDVFHMALDMMKQLHRPLDSDKQWPLLLFLSSYTRDDDVLPVIIKMSNFRLDNAKCTAGPWYSKPFLAFDRGHRMCLVIHTTCDSHLSVYLYLMKGPHDNQLEQWPLTGTFKVELLQQMHDSLHHTTYITFSNTGCRGCADRVLEGDMATSGWGNSKFVSFDIFFHEYNSFLRNDTLYFRVAHNDDEFFYPNVKYIVEAFFSFLAPLHFTTIVIVYSLREILLTHRLSVV